ncbi:MAG: trigger factor, partial [Chloroflexi bacterium]
MNVEVTTLPESRVALKVELTPGEVDQALDRTYRQLVQRVAIPGFRKGKAPRSVVERTVGPDLFLHEATEDAMRWGYRKAIDQEKLVPIDEAEVSAGDDHDHLDVGREFSFEATVSVKPDVQLPDYRGLEIDRSVVEVSDEDVDNLLHDLQERTATLEPTSSPADEGMVVTMNIAGKVGGREIVNEENGEFELRDEERQGSDPVFPGLSRELIGVKPGDIKDIALLLPEMYRDDELAGKTLALRILVKEIKRKILPELGDELAQSVSEMKTLDELRGRLRDNIEIERKYAADQELADRVADAVTSRTFVEIPRVLVEEELDRGVEEMRRAFDSQRLS